MGGDFNISMYQSLDTYNYSNENNKKSKAELANLLLEIGMVDVWRDQNPELKQYTWHKRTPCKMARLDYFFVSEQLCMSGVESYIKPGYRTDHSMICLSFLTNTSFKAKSYWKFNNSLLRDTEYVKLVKTTIDSVKQQYLNTNHNLHDQFQIDTSISIDDQLFLDVMLMEIRGKTISYSSYKKKQETSEYDNILQEIEELEKNLLHPELLEQKKAELINIRQKKMEGVAVRSKAKWVEHGEKVSKYFCGLETRHFRSKAMTKIINDDGSFILNQNEIIQKTKSFYEQLYQYREVNDACLDGIISRENIEMLTKDQSDQFEGIIILEEATAALRILKITQAQAQMVLQQNFSSFSGMILVIMLLIL